MFATCASIIVGTSVAMMLHASLPTPAIKGKMMKLFNAGELYKKRIVKQSYGADYTKKIFPKIKRVGLYEGYKQVIFIVPLGMDPNEVIKKHWLFQQLFGDNIELKGDSKTFNLLIFEQALKPFDYNVEEIKEVIKGFNLPIIAGKTHRGYEVYDMVNDPHLLIAGETGAGKSVQLRSILTTLITQCKNVDLYLADLKRSEFHLFRGIAKTVDIEPVRLYNTLLEINKEMKRRGNLLDQLELAHINDIPESKRPNYIVVCIDEVSLIKDEDAIMEIVEDISSIGRALGIFLILSMQRPDREVLDGKLKNNLTVRMAFRHRDEINSRISLGSEHAATIQKSSKGRHYLALDEVFQVQAPYLPLDKAKELLKPFKSKGELKQNEIITTLDYEVLEEESDILELGGYDYD